VPIDRIVIETDCPYLAPEPNRGKRNSSLYIHYVAERLAEIKGISAEEAERITFENAKKCYNLKNRLQLCLISFNIVDVRTTTYFF
jgi:TatD DNase family protein